MSMIDSKSFNTNSVDSKGWSNRQCPECGGELYNEVDINNKDYDFCDTCGYNSKSNSLNEENKNLTIEDYKNMDCFDDRQLFEIRVGLKQGLNVTPYAKPDLDYDQMYMERMKLEGRPDAAMRTKLQSHGLDFKSKS